MTTAVRANDLCWCGSGRKYKRCHKVSAERVRAGQQSPRRQVPEGIARPDYAEGGRPVLTTEALVKDAPTIEAMRRAGRLATEVLAVTAAAVASGVTTDELDRVCHQACVERGAYPSPLNYHGYPKSVCTSVNEVICHGIPDGRPLSDGDIVNIDVTVFIDGVHGDTNATFPVGRIDADSTRLIAVTSDCLELGIQAVRPGRPVSDIGRAIQQRAEAEGFGVVRSFVGHGIGRVFHNGLAIPHYYDPAAATVMEPGMTFTIEPMITMGSWQASMWPDGWTAVTADGRRSAQFEHMLVVTDQGADVLTRPPSDRPPSDRPVC
ncbi:MAG TPA: type I methionyl aminopeptidase [Acidimicrobiales bacterium]|nr:type I methionyl aminopeptidase [Acidimicrobiales bacterium]